MGVSTADYHNMLARLARKLAVQSSPIFPDGPEEESELHQQIKQECLRRGWLAFHGSMAHKTKRTPGEPDFVILAPSGRLLMIECKVKKRKRSDPQRIVEAWARKLGHPVYLIGCYEQFLKLADEFEKA